MIKIVNFKSVHLLNMKADDDDGNLMVGLGDMKERAEMYEKAGHAFSLVDEEDLDGVGYSHLALASGGVIQYWPGVGEAWLLISPEGRKLAKTVYCEMSSFLSRCFNEYGFHRIQSAVMEGNRRAHKCVMHLGFIPEGMMVNYGPNKEHFIRYVRCS